MASPNPGSCSCTELWEWVMTTERAVTKELGTFGWGNLRVPVYCGGKGVVFNRLAPGCPEWADLGGSDQ